jgi:hypothetical protein
LNAFRIMILVIHLAVGLLMMAMSLPLIRRKVPPNSSYGLRVRKTLDDPSIWYEANEYAGRCLFGLGVWVALGSLALSLVPAINPASFASACLVLTVTGLAASGVLCYRFLGQVTGGPSD